MKAAPGSPNEPVVLTPKARLVALPCAVASDEDVKPVAEAKFLKAPEVLAQSNSLVEKAFDVPMEFALALVRTDHPVGKAVPMLLKSWL